MADETRQPRQRARQAAEGGLAGSFLERLAERIGSQAGVQAVFGQPVERGELTVIPVGRVRWGFGGGSGEGSGEEGSGSGSGGGGGAAAEPVGYVLIGPAGASFEPIRDKRLTAPMILAAGISLALLIRALARLARR